MPADDLRLLALDGGGVRGLSALMILEQLMEVVNPDAPPKPCDYFDMIGGTSTGGLIAIMLGRLRMSVADCITAYLSLSDRVFRKSRHRVTIKGRVQGRFDSEELARAIREVIKQQGVPEDALLKDSLDSTCKVFVCATSKETSETVCLTSYRTRRGNSDLLSSLTIWEACRTTSAATSFFDPISVGRFGEEFVDGATGANNPVRELWDQAQQVWGLEPLEGRVKCLVSIGTGVPSLKPFKDDVFHIGETLVAIATETEQTAERFQREKSVLDSTGRYYRFNVLRGLEDIGLEEAAKVKEVAAATRRYIGSQKVYTQMQACAGNIAGREYFGDYQAVFSLQGVPQVNHFVDRPAQMEEIERVLLPRHRQNNRQKRYILRGLGGIGKTQLAVEFARRHYRRFSGVFWLDGRSEDSLKQSIASCVSRIPQGQIAETSRAYAAGGSIDLDAVVRDVLGWLARPNNAAWLLIFDNVDREYSKNGNDAEAYDVQRYFSGADHGSVLITTRLARLEQLGESQELGKVEKAQAKAILETWYKHAYDGALGEQLLERLDGLPLAIAQAGAYLQESGVSVETYLCFYDRQWDELMAVENEDDTPLQDYPNRSVWTTWAISYQVVRKQHELTANLLLLWSFLDNKDLWHGLFAAACNASTTAKNMLSEWIGESAISELAFCQAMRLLRSYSLVEVLEDATGYATHPVVHRWAHHHQAKRFASKLGPLAVAVVGWAVPDQSNQDNLIVQRRLLAHAQMCYLWLFHQKLDWDLECSRRSNLHCQQARKDLTLVVAVNSMGQLFADQSKLVEAASMQNWALQRYEEALGPDHILTLQTMGYLGMVYMDQGKLTKAEYMIERAAKGLGGMLTPESEMVLQMTGNLGMLYKKQGNLGKAQHLFEQVLQKMEESLGPTHKSTLLAYNNLGILYKNQDRLSEADRMLNLALQGKEMTLGPFHPSTLQTVGNIGIVYFRLGELVKAESMLKRALRGKEEVLGRKHISTMETTGNLGNLYIGQGKLVEAENMYERALQGFEELLGAKHPSTQQTIIKLISVYHSRGKSAEALRMQERALY